MGSGVGKWSETRWPEVRRGVLSEASYLGEEVRRRLGLELRRGLGEERNGACVSLCGGETTLKQPVRRRSFTLLN